MATTLRQFNLALNPLVRGLTAATRASTAPIRRLSDALQPFAPARSSNAALARPAAAAGGVNVDGAHGGPGAAAFGLLRDPRGAFDGSRSRRGIEHLSADLALALRRLAGPAAERSRAARDRDVAGPIARLLEASLRRLAGTFAATSARGGRRELASPKDPVAPAGYTLPGTSWFLSRLPASWPLEHAINAASASEPQWQARRAEGRPGWSAIAGALGGLRATIAELAPLSNVAHVRSPNAVPTAKRGLPGSEPIVSRLARAPRFTLTDYFRRGLAVTPLADARRLPESPLGHYAQRLTALAHKLAHPAVRPASAVVRSIAALPATPRAIGLEPPWPRLPAALADWREAPARRAPRLDRLERAAPASTTPASAPAAPSTINVAINVHGVANGDEFVRRHGYEIARVLDQVMERRARRAF